TRGPRHADIHAEIGSAVTFAARMNGMVTRSARAYDRRVWRAALLALAATACGGGTNATCPVGQTSCGGRCIDTSNDHDHCGACGSACSASLVCGGGQCADSCPLGQAVCA